MNKLVKQWFGFKADEKGVKVANSITQVKIDSDTEKQVKANNGFIFDINGGLKGQLVKEENAVRVMVRKDIHFYTDEIDDDFTKGEINIRLTGDNWKKVKDGKEATQKDTRIEGVEFTIKYDESTRKFTYTHNFKNVLLPYYVEDDVCPIQQ